jgi:hypothetical protein
MEILTISRLDNRMSMQGIMITIAQQQQGQLHKLTAILNVNNIISLRLRPVFKDVTWSHSPAELLPIIQEDGPKYVNPSRTQLELKVKGQWHKQSKYAAIIAN